MKYRYCVLGGVFVQPITEGSKARPIESKSGLFVSLN